MSHTFLLNIDMIFIIFLEKDMLKLFVIIYYSQYSACYGYIKKINGLHRPESYRVSLFYTMFWKDPA